jgi:hypothetical protein
MTYSTDHVTRRLSVLGSLGSSPIMRTSHSLCFSRPSVGLRIFPALKSDTQLREPEISVVTPWTYSPSLRLTNYEYGYGIRQSILNRGTTTNTLMMHCRRANYRAAPSDIHLVVTSIDRLDDETHISPNLTLRHGHHERSRLATDPCPRARAPLFIVVCRKREFEMLHQGRDDDEHFQDA